MATMCFPKPSSLTLATLFIAKGRDRFYRFHSLTISIVIERLCKRELAKNFDDVQMCEREKPVSKQILEFFEIGRQKVQDWRRGMRADAKEGISRPEGLIEKMLKRTLKKC